MAPPPSSSSSSSSNFGSIPAPTPVLAAGNKQQAAGYWRGVRSTASETKRAAGGPPCAAASKQAGKTVRCEEWLLAYAAQTARQARIRDEARIFASRQTPWQGDGRMIVPVVLQRSAERAWHWHSLRGPSRSSSDGLSERVFFGRCCWLRRQAREFFV